MLHKIWRCFNHSSNLMTKAWSKWQAIGMGMGEFQVWFCNIQEKRKRKDKATKEKEKKRKKKTITHQKNWGCSSLLKPGSVDKSFGGAQKEQKGKMKKKKKKKFKSWGVSITKLMIRSLTSELTRQQQRPSNPAKPSHASIDHLTLIITNLRSVWSIQLPAKTTTETFSKKTKEEDGNIRVSYKNEDRGELIGKVDDIRSSKSRNNARDHMIPGSMFPRTPAFKSALLSFLKL